MGACLSTSSTQLDIRTVGDLRLLARELSRRSGIASRPLDGHGDTLLHLAALNGNPSSIRMLLEAGGEIEAADSLGRRAIHIASLSAHKAALLALLENGAAVDAQDGGGSTALMAAAFQGNEACLRSLLANKASVALCDRGGWTALHVAARSGHEPCLQALLENGAAIDKADAFGRTPLAVAAAGGKEGCVRRLLSGGAAVDAASLDGRTALHRAAGGGQDTCVRALLEAGAAPGAVDSTGSSALHAAAAFGSQPVIRSLVVAGADPAAVDGEGRTAAERAEAAGHVDAARLLRQLAEQQQQQPVEQQVEAEQQQEQVEAEQQKAAGGPAAQQQGAEAGGREERAAVSSGGMAAVWGQAAAAAAAAEAAEAAEAHGQVPVVDAVGTAGTAQPAGSRSGSLDDSALASQPALSPGHASTTQNGSGGPGPGPEAPSVPPPAQPQRSNGSSAAGAEQLKPWELRFSDLAFERPIGQGSYGRVYLARLHETPCAVKVLLSWQEDGAGGTGGNGGNGAAVGANGDNAATAAATMEQRQTLTLSSPLLADLRREAGVMAALHHPNCVQLMGICADPAAIVTEYCARGSLYDVLSAARRDPAAARQLTWARRLHLAMGAAQGMLHLHTRTPPVLHRDIKSPNILVDAAWKAKVCDLNLAKAAAGLSSQLSSAGALNPRWLAPEVLAGGSASRASDVFSFGVTMWELLTWRPPWSEVGGNPWQLAAGVIAGKRPEIPPREELPGPDTAQFGGLDTYTALMQRCWAADPAERPDFGEVVRQLRALLATATKSGSGSSSRAAAAGSG